MENRVISIQLLNKILSYLGTKPYLEVVEMISEIMSLAKETPKEGVNITKG